MTTLSFSYVTVLVMVVCTSKKDVQSFFSGKKFLAVLPANHGSLLQMVPNVARVLFIPIQRLINNVPRNAIFFNNGTPFDGSDSMPYKSCIKNNGQLELSSRCFLDNATNNLLKAPNKNIFELQWT